MRRMSICGPEHDDLRLTNFLSPAQIRVVPDIGLEYSRERMQRIAWLALTAALILLSGPIFSENSPEELLFPLYGVMPGSTTEEELVELGAVIRQGEEKKNKSFEINSIRVSTIQGLVSYLFIGKSDDMPEKWKEIGFRWELSYNEWVALFEELGYILVVEEHPSIVMYSNGPSLAALLYAYWPASPIRLRLKFCYRRGSSTDSPGTINGLHADCYSWQRSDEPRNLHPNRETIVLPERKRRAIAMSGILAECNHSKHESLYDWTPTDKSIAEWKEELSESWGVETAEDLKESLVWLEEEGHSQIYNNLLGILDRNPGRDILDIVIEDRIGEGDARRLFFVERMRDIIGERSLRAWDLGRMVSLCRWGYFIGYLSEEETWEMILPVADKIEELYHSWEDFGASFILGRMFWAAMFDEADIKGNQAIKAYTKLINTEKSAWRLPWEGPGDQSTAAYLEDKILKAVSIEETLYFKSGSALSWEKYVKGIEYLEGKLYDDAISYLKKALQGEPGFSYARFYLGLSYHARADIPPAIECYEQFVLEKPHNYLGHRLLGEAYEADSRMEEAIGEFRESICIDGNRPEGYLGLGRIRLNQGRIGEALENLKVAERICLEYENEFIYYTCYMLGFVYFNIADFKTALGFFQKSYIMYRNNPYVNYYIGLCYLNMDNPNSDDALTYLEKAETLGIEIPAEVNDKLHQVREDYNSDPKEIEPST